ncbi:tetratricopeptide repeat protein 8 [Episyrphus balteatus]|uniref:tetratricopeptide repeat protein 8 n=1 Tax=Episyrphus balteatus TaxID=286459 RepID=UPI0024861D2C|nr:tetratricopeptide repeat protein 8 [Episyrphus balteatus]
MDIEYIKAVSLFRRRSYEKCIEVCNVILQMGHENNVPMFTNDDEDTKSINSRSSGNSSKDPSDNNNKKQPTMPTWMMEGIWQLKMRALTQRIFVDDLEANDDISAENEEVEFERIATTARPGTSLKTAFVPRPGSSLMVGGMRPSTHLGSRPTSGIARPGTASARPGSSVGGRPSSRCGTARRVRVTSAAVYSLGDLTSVLYQASRMNPTIYADRKNIIKALFQFLFYHEGEPQKALSLCEAVCDAQRQKVDWWWDQQRGRCLVTLNHPRKAETYLLRSLRSLAHPDTFLLLSKMYQKMDQLEQALQLISSALDKHSYDIALRTEQGRIYELMNKADDSVQVYRLIVKMNPINVEALASIAVNYFYDNNPEMALMYYRRILSMGAHNAELYCNIALCCLYGGQIDLVLPCFQRALTLATTSDQRSDIWYNLSFVAVTTGDFNLARRCLRLCLTSDATNGAALNNLAVLSAHSGDLAKAKSYLAAAKEVLGDSLEIESNLKYMEKNYKL